MVCEADYCDNIHTLERQYQSNPTLKSQFRMFELIPQKRLYT